MGITISSRSITRNSFGKENQRIFIFDYRINEALHMTDEERDLFISLMRQTRQEIEHKHDAVQNAIIVDYIGLMLNFCQRFYNRQFMTREPENSDVLMKFNNLLRNYFDENQQLSLGLPTVLYFADKLCMSSNYFGDLIKRQPEIQQAIISVSTLFKKQRTNSPVEQVLLK